MGISTNSHGKKSDKETQSPILKIFKEIMMKEKNDPEKQNLLVQEEVRRLRQYSGSRERLDRCCDRSDSSNDHRRRMSSRMSDGRGSFMERGCYEDGDDDDQCNCLTCSFRRILGSEFICILCLLMVFIISITIACIVVFKTSVPTPHANTTRKPEKCKSKSVSIKDSERLKRKIEMIDADVKNELNEEGVFGKLSYDKMGASEILEGHESSGLDFGPSFRALNSPQSRIQSRHINMDTQDTDKLKDFYRKLVETDAKIKNLKKLLSDDNNLYYSNGGDNDQTPDRTKRSLKLYKYPKRYKILRRKRGINDIRKKLKHIPRKRKNNIKRYLNANESEPSGFIIEKKKFLIQYKPSRGKNIVAKCSHSPNSHEQHEHQLKHPFYQNTQRLDELLDKFLSNNLPEIMLDPFNIDSLFKPIKKKCKHPTTTKIMDIIDIETTEAVADKKESKATAKKGHGKTATKKVDSGYNDMKDYYEEVLNQIPKPKSKIKSEKMKKPALVETTDSDMMKILKPESTPKAENKMYHDDDISIMDKPTKSTKTSRDSDLVLNFSNRDQSVTQEVKINYNPDPSFHVDKMNMRRLMQIEGEEEENLGYEDFKEVLNDDTENQDDIDRRMERMKREDLAFDGASENSQDIPKFPKKFNPPGIQNPNWKGPMPLYPDELSTMIKHAAAGNSELSQSINDGNTVTESSKKKRNLSDVEYVEDYIDNKYDKLVEMAQAYSDYGVLEGKKEIKMDKKQARDSIVSAGNRVQLSADWNLLPRGLLGVKNKQKEQYGTTNLINSISSFKNDLMGFKITPTSQDREDVDMTNLIKSHIKIDDPTTSTTESFSSFIPMYYELGEIMNKPIVKPLHKRKKEANKAYLVQNFDLNNLTFAASKGRNLLSTLFNRPNYDNNDFEEENFNIEEEKQYSKNKRDVYFKTTNNTKKPVIELKKDTKHKYKDRRSKPYNASEAKAIFDKAMADSAALESYESKVTKNNIKVYKYAYHFMDELQVPNVTNYGVNKVPLNSDSVTIPNSGLSYILNTNATLMPASYGKMTTDFGININEEFANNQELLNLHKNSNTTLDALQSLYSTVGWDSGRENSDPYLEPENPTMILKQIPMYTELENNQNDFFEPVTMQMAVDKELTPDDIESNQNTIVELENELNRSTVNDDANLSIGSGQSQKINILSFRKSADTVLIKQSDIKTNSVTKKYEGKIIMTVKDPDIGKADISINFDSPIIKISNYDYNINEDNYDEEDATDASTNATSSFSNIIKIVKRTKRQLETTKTLKEDATTNNTSKKHEIKMLIIETTLVNSTNTSLNDSGNHKVNSETNNLTLSDFFGKISDWFQTLHVGKEDSDVGAKDNGHRSRKLMSVIEDNVTEGMKTSGGSNDISLTTLIANDTIVTEYNATVKTTLATTNSNKTTSKTDATNSTLKKDSEKPVKIVKRNADESNLIFWNDIYDDEYGILTHSDRAFRIKQYAMESDFLKRSGRWVQDKIKKFADNLRGRDQELPLKKRLARGTKTFRIEENPKFKKIYGKVYKRSTNNEDNPDTYQMSAFTALGAKMAEVCKQAALSVRQTSNTEVKEEPDQSSITTSLMQQLVRLLTDLIDYQVQATTCAKLPPDLKQFLEWLVLADNDEEASERPVLTEIPKIRSTLPYPDDEVIDELLVENIEPTKVTDATYFTPLGLGNMKMDTRNQYVDTIRSVQELLEDYEDMNDQDKCKMTGVKTYLHNQLSSLEKQYADYSYTARQHSPSFLQQRTYRSAGFNVPKIRRKRKVRKFIKNFGKKHTRTTASFYDGILSTELQKDGGNQARLQMEPNRSFKRNLKDVYYKAIAEAKKYASSSKNGHTNVMGYSTTQNAKVTNNVSP